MSAEQDTRFFGIHESIILTKNGIWLSDGEEITHERMILAFSKNIFRCPEGFEIRIGTEKKVIHVEDTFYFVRGLDGSTETGFSIRLNDGRTLPLDPLTIRYQPGRLTCRVPSHQDSMQEEAKFLSSAYYELLRHLEKENDGFSLTIQGEKIFLSLN